MNRASWAKKLAARWLGRSDTTTSLVGTIQRPAAVWYTGDDQATFCAARVKSSDCPTAPVDRRIAVRESRVRSTTQFDIPGLVRRKSLIVPDCTDTAHCCDCGASENDSPATWYRSATVAPACITPGISPAVADISDRDSRGIA